MKAALKILLIEDDMIEVMKFKRVLSSINDGNEYQFENAENGEEALNKLKKNTYTPDIILLDLNMPKITGIEFLSILKNDEKLRYLPTVILSTSNNEKDLLECFKIGIAGYVLKPLKYEDYVAKIKQVLGYWSINQLIKI
ncbi:response regulator [Wenyingzhuangia sp. IMCC45533]